ncbi:Nramp family divalent metal transporter [Aliirhizobium cellulosilyticum]|uniref:Divalent metal cation transporter MntH n=1 Tax=Aliirhizobium cellulosilyticum TaxID=393664 RepID=A0A7W6Y4N8_9HYPH|nr:Nramp family divalent metal transporter [Rhizobium cellulosilyticum]MBB4349341.1 manganese transport protein [Rhizobium cellulosilyticum]MBB4412437.1 manganese transport protein [Rhizobium cellulosilyticum]MBB4447069.1 manganese transport protein [Rhizobium cellulosilyticum]
MSITARQTLSQRTDDEIRQVLAGKRHGARSFFLFCGPAIIASIAYMDPGNFATNIEAGSSYGYALLWVVFVANVMAMLFQALSAKLGIVTGRNLAEMCHDQFSTPTRIAMWIVSEIASMATDLAEFLGGAIGLSLLFDMPLLAGMAVTAIVTYGILLVQGRGFRPLELIIGGLVAVIALCYVAEMFFASVSWKDVALGMVTPTMPDSKALAISVGIIGATIMPHALYLHSGLTQHRASGQNDNERAKILRYSNIECIVALTLAGAVNIAMVVMAAAAFHSGHPEVAEIQTAYHTLTPVLGGAAATFFLISLMASGISSSTVGTMAGQMIMQGFVGFNIPIWLRRLITMVPAFIVVIMGVNSTDALVYSQVVLSFALPIPMISLVIFTRSRVIMGSFANSSLTNLFAVIATALIIGLNVVLLYQTLG